MDYLRKRGNSYFCVISVPLDLQPLLHRKQIWKSLKVKNYQSAKSYAKRFLHYVDDLFLKVRFGIMHPDLLKAMVADYSLTQLRALEGLRTKVIPISDPSPEFVASHARLSQMYTHRTATSERREKSSSHSKNRSEKLQDTIAAGKIDEIKGLSRTVKMFEAIHNANIPEDSDDFRTCLHAFAHSRKVVSMIESERILGNYESTLQHSMIAKWEAELKAKPNPGILIPELFDKYYAAKEADYLKKNRPDLAKKRREKLDYLLTSFMEWNNNVPMGVNEFTDEKAEEWRDWFLVENDVLKPKTVNNRLEDISAAFNWGRKLKGSKKLCNFNPAKELLLPLDENPRDRNRKFTEEELQQFFDLLAHYSSPNTPEQTWLPTIMLFTGCRCNEVAQLYLDDIIEDKGIYYFRLLDSSKNGATDRNQHIKGYRERNVPVHNKLIELGLIKYRDRLRGAGEVQLFPNCKFLKSQGTHYSGALSILLNSILDMVTDDRKLRVYCLRTQFRNEVNRQLIGAKYTGDQISGKFVLDDIMGHAIQGSKGDTDYQKAELQNMAIILNLAEYAYLDFTQLQQALSLL